MGRLFSDCGCGCDGKKQEQKLLISVMSALLFYIIANPETFKLVRRILGGWVSSPTGCPTMNGLVLHALVFLFITWALMNVKKEFAEGDPAPAPEEDISQIMAPEPAPADNDVDVADIVAAAPDPSTVPRPSKENVSVCNCDDGSEILRLMPV